MIDKDKHPSLLGAQFITPLKSLVRAYLNLILWKFVGLNRTCMDTNKP
jgi:hypothetical protein